MSSCMITVNEMNDRKEFDLKNTVTNQPAGVIQILQFSLIEKPSFIEYLRSGW